MFNYYHAVGQCHIPSRLLVVVEGNHPLQALQLIILQILSDEHS